MVSRAAVLDTSIPVAPGAHVFAVVVMIEDGGGEANAAQVASTCYVAHELNLTEVEFNYLPMDVVCNGTPS